MKNQEKKKVSIRRACIEEAIHLRGTSIRKLGAVEDGIGWSEKTIRRALEDGKIAADLLEALAKKLDVDPYYLMGKYHEGAESYSDPQVRAWALHNIRIERYPYLKQIQREKIDGHILYDRYLEGILAIHNLSLKQFEEMPFSRRKELQIAIEDAICPVLCRFFDRDAEGNDICPNIYSLQNDIEDYDPDFVEPPDEFFEEMMQDDYDPFAEKYNHLPTI